MESINGIDAQVLVSHSKPTFIFKHKNMIHVKPQPASPPPNMKSGSNAPKKVAANPFLSPPLEEDKFGEDLCTIPETTSGFKLSKAANTMSAPPISLTQATAPLQNDLIRSSNVFNLNNQLNNSDNEIERENLVIDNHALTNFSSINSNNINPSKYNHLSNSNLIKPSVIQHNLLNNNLLQKNINHIPFGHLPITSAMKGNAQLLKPLGGIRSGDELFEDAMRCETGESVFLNVIRSSMLFKSAADAGHDGAIFWYAKKLTYGIGIRPNPREAAKMFKTASEHGTKDAAFMFYEALMKSGGNIREVIFFIKAGLRENDLSSNFAVVKCVEENGEIMWPVCEALLSLKFCLRRCYKPFSPTYFNFAKKYLTTSDLSTLLSESRNDSSISYFLAVLITEKLVDLSFIHNKDNEAKKLLEDSFEAGYKPAFDYFLKCQYSLNEYDFSKTHHLIIHGCEFARNGNAILAVEEWQKAVNQDCKWNPDFQSLKTVSQQLNNHVDNDPSYENASQIFLSLLEYWAKAGSGEAKEILGEILISGRNGLEKNISRGLMHLKAAFDNENYEMENYQLLKDNCTGFYGEK
ncbi:hypothetical protein TRFO_16932 [Tritrichomonas foetus]|uniref:Uncharacterized protein n=1 Tax=Tritrichomonas foetus TaxID=1144522 RepID=A0A1J4KNW8_9EUKA|nr:hypothetical protein TRFO_16932 [Tritrichomonas foetus]|eukprot:OHT12983.1 hypothetical protein TRFO_16932 [Tritrichomonas foetus]